MGFIKQDQIDELKDRLDIVDIISEYVNLKRAGSSFKGLCPFHNEKTPSFSVSRERGYFHCFGCHERGDAISFIMKIENLNYVDALKFLADKYGMTLEESYSSQESIDRRKRLYEINSMAAKFYMKNLLTDDFPQEYMQKRGLSKRILNRFFLGYAKNDNGLYEYLKSKGVEDSEMLELGLVSQFNNRIVDKFQDRLIFPILNNKNKVIGFGGRTLTNNKIKYLNSPESEIFKKRNNVYGVNVLNKTRNQNKIILVEGYMDVIGLYNKGIDYSAATLGTALTEEQARIIKRYGNEIYIAYDGDTAGIKATLRAIDIFKNMDVQLEILEFPDGMDPDEYISKYGLEEFEKLLKNSTNPIDFKLQKLLDLSPNKSDFIKEVITFLSEFKGNTVRDIYIDKAAKFLGVTTDSLRKDVEEKINQNKKSKFGNNFQTYNNGYKLNTRETIYDNEKNSDTYDIEKMIVVYSLTNKDNYNSLKDYFIFIKDKELLNISKSIDSVYKGEIAAESVLESDLFRKHNLFSYFSVAKLNADNEEVINELIDRIEKIKLSEELKLIKENLTKDVSNEDLINKYQELLKKLT
ncbi:DNA primase [Helcococcus sueciensis]|uniref:DNA primase n=1 Tax=Helcococcus sueciensis TaxID=241555 RepID=UPI000417CBE9|nr:DNA primase [Helcococcus sueciensis]